MVKDSFNDDFMTKLLNILQKQGQGISEEELLKKIERMDITKIYNTEIKKSVDSTFLKFKDLTEEKIKNNLYNYEKFKKTHYNIWGKCLDYSEMMYSICVNIMDRYCKYFSDLEKENETSVKSKEYTFLSLREISVRACQEYLEIFTLIKDGLADGAYARWRSLYELSIIAQFIQEYGENVAMAFYNSSFNFDEINYEWAKKAACFSGYTSSSIVSFNAIQNNCSNVTNNWKKHYKSACKAVHANPVSTFGRISISSNIGSTGIGRSIFGIDEPAKHAAVSLNCVISTFLKLFVSSDIIIMLKLVNKWTWLIRDCYSKTAAELDNSVRNDLKENL